MTGRLLALAIALPLFAAGPSIEGRWIWETKVYTGAVDLKGGGSTGPIVSQTFFTFSNKAGVLSGEKFGGRGNDEPLRNVTLKGDVVTFYTGKKGGSGPDLLTRWEGKLTATKIEGKYFFEEHDSYGTFLLTRSSAQK